MFSRSCRNKAQAKHVKQNTEKKKKNFQGYPVCAVGIKRITAKEIIIWLPTCPLFYTENK